MATPKASEEDGREAVRRLLVGLAADQDVFQLSAAVADLHPKNDTFPGEVFMRLAAEVVADTTVAGAGPISYVGLRERHLAEYEFSGKENRKFQYAVLCSAAVAGGLEPDLLDALIRAGAHCREVPVPVVVAELVERHRVSVPMISDQ
jgi:hypothetical protein